MPVASEERLAQLRLQPSKVFNVCILAHVDHGKTSLADSLVATAGLLPSRLAGRLRFLDFRPDEQERGITLKSSGVTIPHRECLVNLIDSPGHVDFAGEVSTAVRLCDGAVVVVDVVEGVCAQTRAALRAARQERLRPLLVLNKIDRLALELHLTPLDAYARLEQLLEQLNAAMAADAVEVIINDEDENGEIKDIAEDEASDDYFVPSKGNVVFASAFDAWGFCTEFFANLYSERLGISAEQLLEALWGDFYISGKPSTVRRGAAAKAKKPLFVTLILDNLWALYDTICIRRDKEKLARIIETLGLKVTARDMRQTDSRLLAQAVLSQWLPLGTTVLDAICNQLPSAADISEEKVELLMTSGGWSLETYPPETRALKQDFMACESSSTSPTIAFVSKMFPVSRKALPQNKIHRPMFSREDLAAKREAVRLAKMERLTLNDSSSENADKSSESLSQKTGDMNNKLDGDSNDNNEVEPLPDENEEVFIALARVYSGTVRPGQKMYVLGPKHDPRHNIDIQEIENLTVADLKPHQHVTKAEIKEVYTLMGRELGICQEAPAGSVVGLGGLTEHVLKSATLSSELACPPFCGLRPMAVPILRVAVEPTHPKDLPALRQGLRLLNQADACVQVLVQETGEHVLMTAGELHLERCLRDLREQFAKININVSEPIIPFRETVIPPPKVDMANEVIEIDSQPSVNENDTDVVDGVVTVKTPDRLSSISIRAEPLPEELEASILAGFDAAVVAGPLCEEPMRGVCFVLVDCKIADNAGRQLAGQLLSASRDACRKAFQAQPQRLVAAMFQCHIAASPEVVGKVHGVIARRQGRVISMEAGPASCQVMAVLPVIESFSLAPELRKATSGLASAQLEFSHWETLDADPFWIPRTEEELIQFGDAVSGENRARVYIDSVRKRKGLSIQAQIVQNAEKQRTKKK